MYIINIEDMKRLPGVLKMLCCVWKCYIYPALSVWYLISANRGFPSDPTSSRLASSCRTRNDKKWQVLVLTSFGKNSITFTILNRGSIVWTRLISCKNVFFLIVSALRLSYFKDILVIPPPSLLQDLIKNFEIFIFDLLLIFSSKSNMSILIQFSSIWHPLASTGPWYHPMNK